MLRRAAFLDRDGVINSMVYNPEFGIVDSPSNPDEFTVLPGVAEAIIRLKKLRFLTIVVSNQPGIAKGKFSSALLAAMTAKMVDAIGVKGGLLDDIYYCLHHPDSVVPEYKKVCDCRKPRSGMLLEAAKKWSIDLGRSYMIGDGISDVLAGSHAGTTTILVNARKCYICDELHRHAAQPDYIASCLPEAVELICEIESRGFENDLSSRRIGCKPPHADRG